jgi:predicted porin
MKRSILLVFAALMVLSSGFAFAKEVVEVEAGIKMWYPGWKNEDPTGGSLKFDPTLLVGPAIEVKLPSHLFFEASYLLSTSDFEKTEGTAKLTADRKDLDIAVGYDFIPEVGIFIGYKNSSMDWKLTDTGGNDSGSMDLSGPVIGLRGKYSFSDMFGVYASAAYLMTKVENKDSTGTVKEDSPGTVFELGVKAKFNKELSATLGYKVESTKEDKSNIKDTFSGVTLGVMYAF